MADLIEKYKCDQHPMKVCYLKRGIHQTLLPIVTKVWADLIVSIIYAFIYLEGVRGVAKR